MPFLCGEAWTGTSRCLATARAPTRSTGTAPTTRPPAARGGPRRGHPGRDRRQHRLRPLRRSSTTATGRSHALRPPDGDLAGRRARPSTRASRSASSAAPAAARVRTCTSRSGSTAPTSRRTSTAPRSRWAPPRPRPSCAGHAGRPATGTATARRTSACSAARPRGSAFHELVGTTPSTRRVRPGWRPAGRRRLERRRHAPTSGVRRPARTTFLLRNADGDARPRSRSARSPDIRVTGDWDGDGTTEVGVWRPAPARFTLRGADGVTTHGHLRRVGDRPVTGDWNGDGKHRPRRLPTPSTDDLHAAHGRRRRHGAVDHDRRRSARPATCRSPATGTATASTTSACGRPTTATFHAALRRQGHDRRGHEDGRVRRQRG